jgi:hypothetical protein
MTDEKPYHSLYTAAGFKPMKIQPWFRQQLEIWFDAAVTEILKRHGVESVQQLPANVNVVHEVKALLREARRTP